VGCYWEETRLNSGDRIVGATGYMKEEGQVLGGIAFQLYNKVEVKELFERR
jgi:hypothetical protein